jgi:hypothetical protein
MHATAIGTVAIAPLPPVMVASGEPVAEPAAGPRRAGRALASSAAPFAGRVQQDGAAAGAASVHQSDDQLAGPRRARVVKTG